MLPPTWPKAKHYGYDIFVNYNIGVDSQSYLALAKMKKEHPELDIDGKDPLLEAKHEAEREGDEKLAKELQPTQRVAAWIIDRNAEDEGPQFWAIPFTVDKAFANLSFDEDTKEVVYIDDPDSGCDVRFYKEGTGMLTKYDPSKMRLLKPAPLHEDAAQAEEWLSFAQANPIPDCLQFYDYNHIKGVFNSQGRPDEDEDDDTRQEAPARNGRSGRSAQRQATDEEETTPPPRKPTLRVTDPEEETEAQPPAKAGLSIRERLAARNRVAPKSPTPDDDEE